LKTIKSKVHEQNEWVRIIWFNSLKHCYRWVLSKGGQTIDRKFITSGIVKRTGKYTANVRLHRDVIVELPYEIIAE
jgi:hypothetical protein